jgi:hypothetical protein
MRIREQHDSSRRLPACMLCVLDHLAPGLPPGPQALLIRYGRHAHDGGCGMYPGLRSLSRDLRASPVTLRRWRADLQARGLVHRLPRAGPRGADLLRLGPCDHCPQRDCMQSRCERCQRDSLQHAESEWWAAQRDSMQSQKGLRLQRVPAATPATPASWPAAASPNGHRPGDVPSSPDPSRVSLRSTDGGKQTEGDHFPPFQAEAPLVRAQVGAARPESPQEPGAPTGETVSNPGDGRLFGIEPVRRREHWR